MKRFLGNKLVRALFAVLIAGLVGTWAAGAVRDKHEVAQMSEKMKPVCVGRFLIDMPEEAQVRLDRARIDGFDIATFAEGEAEFSARLAAREAELRAKPDRPGGGKNLEAVRQVNTASGLVGRIFIHSRTITEGTAAKGLKLERYRYENVSLEALVHAKGISIDVAALDGYDPNLVVNLPRLLAKLVANPGNHIPAEPGFCVDQAYFRDPLTADQGEEVAMLAGLPSHPDVQFMLMLSAGEKPVKRGLLERHAETIAKLPLSDRMRFSQLRAGPRTIGTLTGDEIAERVVEENHSTVFGFWWEVNGTQNDVFAPSLSFTMDTGKGNGEPVPSSLSERAAVHLWDKITSSIRLFQARAPAVAAAEPPATPLGTLTTAGEVCPQSGWWACGDAGGVAVQGGERQYLRQGDRMPQALLLPAQTVWERLRGLQRSYEADRPTTWKLVDRRSRERVPPALPLEPATSPLAAVEPSSVLAQPQACVGASIVTGDACPASGWWRCEESHALDGTRWFGRQSLLPAATFVLPARTFGATGAPKAIQRRATWRLVRLAEGPEPLDNGGTV